MAGVDPKRICEAATWAFSSTFVKYYRLFLMAEARSDFGRRVLRLTGSSDRRVGTCSLSGYPQKEEWTPIMIFPQAVVNVTLVTALLMRSCVFSNF